MLAASVLPALVYLTESHTNDLQAVFHLCILYWLGENCALPLFWILNLLQKDESCLYWQDLVVYHLVFN